MLEDVDVKHLRWVSWIIGDGSQIRSLSGRSAKLGDGISRNPSDRDALIEQRTKDLEGRTGQLRGFSLDGFLSDYEDGKYAYPWSLPSDSVPDADLRQEVSEHARGSLAEGTSSSQAKSAASRAELMASSGVTPVLNLVYSPDYARGPTSHEGRRRGGRAGPRRRQRAQQRAFRAPNDVEGCGSQHGGCFGCGNRRRGVEAPPFGWRSG